ncbi:MAG: hypothetical protein U0572_02780 [Phycisphaerales bacterium]
MVSCRPSERAAARGRRQVVATGARRAFALIEVLVGGILLAIGLSAVLVIGSRALDMQRRGERDVIASALLDGILSQMLADGPKDYVDMYPLSGTCDPPFTDFDYAIEVDDGAPGVPFRVLVRVSHITGQEWFCETSIAPKLGDEPDPDRMPEEPLDRQARYQEEEDQRNGTATGSGSSSGSTSGRSSSTR